MVFSGILDSHRNEAITRAANQTYFEQLYADDRAYIVDAHLLLYILHNPVNIIEWNIGKP